MGNLQNKLLARISGMYDQLFHFPDLRDYPASYRRRNHNFAPRIQQLNSTKAVIKGRKL